MVSGNEQKRSGPPLYNLIFVVLLLCLALMPVFFYWSKVHRNPVEFGTREKTYMTIEVKVRDILSDILPLVKIGDIQKDHNGEENARILSILKVEPEATGKISLNEGGYVNFSSGKQDLYLLLRVRYIQVRNESMLYPSTMELKVGKRMEFEFQDYSVYGEIVKVNRP